MIPTLLPGVLMFPGFDPVAIGIGPIQVRWYALAYITGLVLAWRIARHLVRLHPIAATAEQVDDFLTWATLGVVLGGRIGYVVLYQPLKYLHDPLAALQVWQGGMSFHGGAIGVAVAMILFTRKHRLALFPFADRIATVTPIGLALGRLANFINGELWGRPADPALPWAMIFPESGTMDPRHPSQLYQMGMEGILLGILLAALCARPGIRARPGILVGAFMAGYGVARIIGEQFREPDAFIGFLPGHITLGQVYSYPMVACGLLLIALALRRGPVPPAPLALSGVHGAA